tara:strand:- start:634 stop:738 length:105 start_codon:yes stop_codon:yes gene_type:complete
MQGMGPDKGDVNGAFTEAVLRSFMEVQGGTGRVV